LYVITFHLLLYIPEFTVVDDVVTDEGVVAVINRTQINDDNATNSLHFTMYDKCKKNLSV